MSGRVRSIHLPFAMAACLLFGACSDDDGSNGATHEAGATADAAPDAASKDSASFFVSSDTSSTANLGGLSGADARCQTLADAAGFGEKTWHAYLSAEDDPDEGEVNARDRIGSGPWHNVEGALIASDLDELHARAGDADLFLDEQGNKINGQWPGSPSPNHHDILTGSTSEGTVMAGLTCDDWTSESTETNAQIGHSDGLGPGQNDAPPFSSWNSSHSNGGCDDTAPLGGAGKIYCFAVN